MRSVAWLIGIVVLGIGVLTATLLVLEPRPTAVDHPDAELGGPPVSTTGTAVATVRRLVGDEDITELIGEDVEIAIDIGTRANDVAFWTGSPPDELLVVLDRDTRSGRERQLGLPSDHHFLPPPGGRVTVRGVVEPLPHAEAMYSWGLTRRDVLVLQNRGAYVRAYEVASHEPGRTDRPAAESIDEFERETAPPPGEQGTR